MTKPSKPSKTPRRRGRPPTPKTKAAPEKTREQKIREAFLAELRNGSSIAAAATSAGISRPSVYRWRAMETPEMQAFAEAWDEAVEQGTDRLEDEALRRAVDGVSEPVFYRGVVVGHITRYSDTMLAMLLNARRPEKFRQNHKHVHTGGIKVTVSKDDAEL